jgi:hypothetical protein
LYNLFLIKLNINNKIFLAISLFILVMVINYTNIINIFILDKSYSEKWNFQTTKEFLMTQDLSDKKVMGTSWFLSNFFNNKADVGMLPLLSDKAFSLPEIQESGVDYLILDTDMLEPMFLWWMTPRNNQTFLKMPKNLLYSTFMGSSLLELMNLPKVNYITKPWQSYETNFFIFKVPQRTKEFRGVIIKTEEFDNRLNMMIKGGLGLNLRDIGYWQNKNCLGTGCILVPAYKLGELEHDVIDATNIPRSLRISTMPFKLEAEYLYRVKVRVKPLKVSPIRDGFIKVELFSTELKAKSESRGERIFVSARHSGLNNEWEEKEIYLYIPKGLEFATVSFQLNTNKSGDFLFDHLSIERSLDKNYDKTDTKDNDWQANFPEDLIFRNSIN